jgi:RNA polymerase sigma-70 factor (ECF subfamily)
VTLRDRDDEQLMAAYVAGDVQSFQELFRRYAPLLETKLAAWPGNRNDVADLVQQTFLQLHRARNEFDPRYKLRPWLVTIAINVSREASRRKLRRHELLFDFEAETAPTGPTDHRAPEPALVVREAMAQLPPEQREAIELHWIKGLPFYEIAEGLGISAGAARVRAHRGYDALRKLLRPSG